MATRKNTLSFSGGNTRACEGDFDQVWAFNATGAVWTDETTDASTSAGNDIPLGTAVGSELYLGMDVIFTGAFLDASTNAAGGTRVLEYWNGASWVALTATFITGAVLLSADTALRFDPPADWATTSVNGSPNRFWIRFRTTVLHTTGGTLTQISSAAFCRVFNAKTINLPAVTGRTITNAYLRVFYYQPVAGVQIDLVRIRSRVDAAAFTDDLYRTTAATLTGEASTDELVVDMTSKLVAGFTGTSHTLDAECAILVRGNNATANNTRQLFSMELEVTYEYDDAQAVQMNTVKIPIESITGDLTATLANIGTNQVPQLTGAGSPFLEESGITIRQIYFVFDGNMRAAGTADFTLGVRLDAEAEATPWGVTDNENQTDCRLRMMWERNDMDPTVAHNLQARVSSVAGAVWSQFGGYLVVTYEYDESTTTRYTFSAQAILTEETGYLKGTTSVLADFISRKFFIPETSPTLKQSGLQFRYQSTADAGNILIRNGSQAFRTYAVTQGLGSDDYTIFHRFDSGAAQGSGITFARGEITLDTRYYADTTVTAASTATALMMLNYSYEKTSGRKTSKASELKFPDVNASAARRLAALSFPIPESNYFLNSYFHRMKTFSGLGANGCSIKINRGDDLGWEDAASYMLIREVELGHNWQFGRIRPNFKRYPADPETNRIDLELSRNWAVEFSSAVNMAMIATAWWHDYTYTVAGTVSNFAGSGIGIPVAIFRADNNEFLGEVLTTSGGAFTFTWYDNTVAVYAVAYESSTRKGNSAEQVAGSTFNIDLNPSGGGGPTGPAVVWGAIA